MSRLSVGETAPNFDLSSTEDVLLMLRDEVVRTAIVLYVCGDATTEASRGDLLALSRQAETIAAERARVLVVSASKVDALKEIQRDLHLPFPLLHDDRGFAARYGVAAGDDSPTPALLVIDRDQRVSWIAPSSAVEETVSEAVDALRSLPSPTAKLPGSIVNRLIDRWVN
jgi:peroxiredoxin